MSDAQERLASIDFLRLNRWLLAQGLADGELQGPTLLAGGTQNLIVRFHCGGREFVLRKAAGTAYANGSETMRREARILAALAGTDVPHARLIAACEDDTVLGGAFYLMEPVEGFNVGMGMPEPHASQPAMRRAMGFALIDGLAALRRVDPVAAGLSDLGHLDGFLERQVGRWRTQLESYARYEGWPGANGLPQVEAVGRWLEQHMPKGFTPGILHGDYHIKNVLFRPDSSALAAIVDWELSTVGDPMIDLGWLMATWRGQGADDPGSPIEIEPWSGFPTAVELVDCYAERTGADVSHSISSSLDK
ncbi:MAG: phosphotransferase family protein [Hydrogenophaga sp.]|uniref:phosphotransferase family protein n=1 Tax=Hydrogenophaga sp. TaxID=1904254 RepID=UPI00272FFF1B|nr:phosphotransferase family protein [Hydrogenophaga sp.]MDP2166179.1 phosphotransferase family protein [Hydrogenophaga sp.]MDP3477560.1 phosphotransferase family protein [Hydrogenophaga sp.]